MTKNEALLKTWEAVLDNYFEPENKREIDLILVSFSRNRQKKIIGKKNLILD